MKALQKGLTQLCEEGATQLFKPIISNDLVLGAVGVLQFEVVAQRLRDEYKVECQFEAVGVQQARWIRCQDDNMLSDFKRKLDTNLSYDHAEELVYLAPTRINLQILQLAASQYSGDIEAAAYTPDYLANVNLFYKTCVSVSILFSALSSTK